jgi:hypothetical protein
MMGTMSTIFWMFLAGALAGLLAAGLARSTAGRPTAVRVVLATVALLVVAFAAWLAFMVFGVGPSLRRM